MFLLCIFTYQVQSYRLQQINMQEEDHQDIYHRFSNVDSPEYESKLSMPTDIVHQEQVNNAISAEFISIYSGSSEIPQQSNTDSVQQDQPHSNPQQNQARDIANQTQLTLSQTENTQMGHQPTIGEFIQTICQKETEAANKQENTMSNQVQEPNRNSREKDDNNGHKKFITQLNNILKKPKYSKLRKDIKNWNLKHPGKKGSRYAFTMKLMDIHKFGGIEVLEEEIMQYFLVQTNKRLVQTDKLTQAQSYLKSITVNYQKSMKKYVQEGEIVGSLDLIYDIKGCKQKTHKAEGIKHIRDYKEKLSL